MIFWIILSIQLIVLIVLIYINYQNSKAKGLKTQYSIFLIVLSMILTMTLFEFEPFGLKANVSKLSGGNGGDWLQFWGTYLGVIFSGSLALYISYKDKKQERRNKIISLYLEDLRNINQELSSLDFDGKWSIIFHTEIELSSEDVERIQEIFYEINKEFYKMKCFPKIKRIISGMPIQKSKIFSEDVLKVMQAIDNLTYYRYNDFRSDETMLSNPGIDKDYLQTSLRFIKQMDLVSKAYIAFSDKVARENAVYNSF